MPKYSKTGREMVICLFNPNGGEKEFGPENLGEARELARQPGWRVCRTHWAAPLGGDLDAEGFAKLSPDAQIDEQISQWERPLSASEIAWAKAGYFLG